MVIFPNWYLEQGELPGQASLPMKLLSHFTFKATTTYASIEPPGLLAFLSVLGATWSEGFTRGQANLKKEEATGYESQYSPDPWGC